MQKLKTIITYSMILDTLPALMYYIDQCLYAANIIRCKSQYVCTRHHMLCIQMAMYFSLPRAWANSVIQSEM